MSFIRPEARAAIWRWREVLVGVVALCVGLWWIAGPGRLMGWLGGAAVLAGVAMIWTGLPLGRFRGASGGLGHVEVIEGRITYFGPLTGGAADRGDITEIRLFRAAKPAHWQIISGSETLSIPVNASGTDALFDAFVALPGLESMALVDALNSPSRAPYEQVWRREGA